MIRFFDLFPGVGGFRAGLKRAGGFPCVRHREIDKHADCTCRLVYGLKGAQVYRLSAHKGRDTAQSRTFGKRDSADKTTHTAPQAATGAREGASLSCPDSATNEDIERLTAALEEQGYTAADSGDDVPNCLTVELPRDGFSDKALDNLKKIVASKEALLKKALAADRLPIVERDGKLCFPWFTLHGQDGEADAYNHLIAVIGNMALQQKRVTAKERESENDKFTMRLFLIRLGFIGDEYRTARRILLQNLTGNSSWKNGQPPVREQNGEGSEKQ